MSETVLAHLFRLLTFLCFYLSFIVLIIPTRTPFTGAMEVNRTLDDASAGDDAAKVTYIGNKWNIGQDCGSTCFVHPDPKQAFNGTWHDTTAFGGVVTAQVVVNFVGTAVYVFCILANSVPNAGTSSKFNFAIDGEPSGPDFDHEPSSSSDYIYNALVYQKNGLSNGAHTLTVTVDSDEPGSLMLFDYVIYTQVIPDPLAQLVQPQAPPTPQTPTSGISSKTSAPLASNIDSSGPSTKPSPDSSPLSPTARGNTSGLPLPSSSETTSGNSNGGGGGLQGNSEKHLVGVSIGCILGGVLGLCLVIFYIYRKGRSNAYQVQHLVRAPIAYPQWLQTLIPFLENSNTTPHPSDILQSPISETTLSPPSAGIAQAQGTKLDLEAATDLPSPDSNDQENMLFALDDITTGSEHTGIPDNATLQRRVRALTEEVEMLREQVYRPTSYVSAAESGPPAYEPPTHGPGEP